MSQLDMELIRRVKSKPGSFYSDRNVFAVRQAFMEGSSVEEIREDSGMSRDTIYSYVSDLVPLRKRKRTGRVTRINRSVMLAMMARGTSRSDIAAHFEMKPQGITMYLKRNPLSDDEKSSLNK